MVVLYQNVTGFSAGQVAKSQRRTEEATLPVVTPPAQTMHGASAPHLVVPVPGLPVLPVAPVAITQEDLRRPSDADFGALAQQYRNMANNKQQETGAGVHVEIRPKPDPAPEKSPETKPAQAPTEPSTPAKAQSSAAPLNETQAIRLDPADEHFSREKKEQK